MIANHIAIGTCFFLSPIRPPRPAKALVSNMSFFSLLAFAWASTNWAIPKKNFQHKKNNKKIINLLIKITLELHRAFINHIKVHNDIAFVDKRSFRFRCSRSLSGKATQQGQNGRGTSLRQNIQFFHTILKKERWKNNTFSRRVIFKQDNIWQ